MRSSFSVRVFRLKYSATNDSHMRVDSQRSPKRIGSKSRLVYSSHTLFFHSGSVQLDLPWLVVFPRCIPSPFALKKRKRHVSVQGGFAEVFSSGQTLHYTACNPVQRRWGITCITYALYNTCNLEIGLSNIIRSAVYYGNILKKQPKKTLILDVLNEESEFIVFVRIKTSVCMHVKGSWRSDQQIYTCMLINV